ncbi:unnamed protein product [Closterium sp. Yama58-4]|nr:unnamed protein product [Closterium sp. Yama58-4]
MFGGGKKTGSPAEGAADGGTSGGAGAGSAGDWDEEEEGGVGVGGSTGGNAGVGTERGLGGGLGGVVGGGMGRSSRAAGFEEGEEDMESWQGTGAAAGATAGGNVAARGSTTSGSSGMDGGADSDIEDGSSSSSLGGSGGSGSSGSGLWSWFSKKKSGGDSSTENDASADTPSVAGGARAGVGSGAAAAVPGGGDADDYDGDGQVGGGATAGAGRMGGIRGKGTGLGGSGMGSAGMGGSGMGSVGMRGSGMGGAGMGGSGMGGAGMDDGPLQRTGSFGESGDADEMGGGRVGRGVGRSRAGRVRGRPDILACSFLMATTMLVAYISKKLHWVYFPESSAALVLGMVFGVLSLVLEDDLAFTFSPEIFFYGLLPIIIFNAGYALKKKDFFRNFWTITLFAVVGTIISTLVYGLATYSLVRAGIVTHITSDSPLLESLIFGSLISAIDPVATLSILQDVQAPTLLYNLVFGESLVNDAVSIVLFRTFASFTNQEFSMASIATAIGILVSLLCALALRFIDINSEFSKFELSLVLVSGYLSYSVAEMLSLSGIMALFFCGICNAHYGYYNISHASKISSKYAFEALSFMAEMFVFAYLGMQVVVMQHVIDWGLLLSAIPLCLISRAFNVFPLSFLSNCTQANKIPTKMVLIMWLSGLRGAIAFALALNMPQRNPAIISTTVPPVGLRGAIAFALALNMPQRNPAIISTTLFVVVLTTVVMGGSTCPLLRALGLSAAHPPTLKHARGSLAGSSHDVPLIGGRSLNDLLYMQRSHSLSLGPPSGLHKWFKWLDQHYLKPLFGGRAFRDQHISEQLSVDEEEAMEGIPCFFYRGVGFSLSVPRNWIEELPSAFEDHVLVKFSDSDVTIDGDPVAELDVICFSVRPSGILSLTEFGDPMNFLLTEWDNICPELAAGVSVSSKVGSSSGAGSSRSSSKAGGAGTSKPLVLAEGVKRSVSFSLPEAASVAAPFQPPPAAPSSATTSATAAAAMGAATAATTAGAAGAAAAAAAAAVDSVTDTVESGSHIRGEATFSSIFGSPTSPPTDPSSSHPSHQSPSQRQGSGRDRLSQSSSQRSVPSGASGREQTSQAALPSMPSLARARSQTSHAARAAPAFVIWAEELISAGGKFFRYELVVHPEDLGDHKADIQHLLLCAGVSNGAVHVCRVRGTEAFFFDGRPLLKHILDSFALS